MNKAGPPRGPIRLLSAYGVLLAGTMAGIYLVSQILRNSIGVIAPDVQIVHSVSKFGLCGRCRSATGASSVAACGSRQ